MVSSLRLLNTTILELHLNSTICLLKLLELPNVIFIGSSSIEIIKARQLATKIASFKHQTSSARTIPCNGPHVEWCGRAHTCLPALDFPHLNTKQD